MNVIIGALYTEVHYILQVCIDILIKEKRYYICPPSEEQREEVVAILSKIGKGEIEKNNIKDALIKCIKLDGYNADIYYFYLLTYGDNSDMGDDMYAIADYFLVDFSRIEKRIGSLIYADAKNKMQEKSIEELTYEE